MVLCVTMPRLILEIAARLSDLQFFRLCRWSRGRGMFGQQRLPVKVERHARTQEVTGWQYPSDAVQQIASLLCVLD